jgi:hypothetical protein
MKRSSYVLLPLAFLLITNITSFSQDLSTIAKQDPFKISGTLNAKLQFYNTDKTNPSLSPFVWYLQGSPVVSLYGIVLPFSFRISEQQRDFRQPFNQFGVSPTYKWATLHLGYKSLNWSTFALAGHSISGAGFELSPGKFHIGFISGRLLKPVKYIDNPEVVMTQTPAYKRKGTAFTFGYGTEKNNINLVIMKAKDDSTSAGDIPLQYQVTPDENLVVSLISKQVIAKKFIFDLEVAQSLYTANMGTKLSDTTGGFMARSLSFLMKSHLSTTSSNAIQTSIGYQSDIFKLLLKYQRIDPNFKSMGAYYFLTDISNITIEPTIKIMKNKLTLGGSFGSQFDNLNHQKNLRTNRTITSARVTFIPVAQYNLSATYSNYGLAQQSGLLSIDTLRKSEVAQATRQFGLVQSLNLAGKYFTHNFMINFNSQKLNDRNQYTSQYSEFSTNILSAGYFISYMPWNLNASVSFNYTNFKQDTITTKVTGPSVSLGKSFLKNKMNTSISYSTVGNTVQNEKTNRISILSFQLGYTPVRNHRLSLKYNHQVNEGLKSVYPSYFENRLDFDYIYTF